MLAIGTTGRLGMLAPFFEERMNQDDDWWLGLILAGAWVTWIVVRLTIDQWDRVTVGLRWAGIMLLGLSVLFLLIRPRGPGRPTSR